MMVFKKIPDSLAFITLMLLHILQRRMSQESWQ